MGLFKRKEPEERPQTDIQEIKKAVKEEGFSRPVNQPEDPKKELPKLNIEESPKKVGEKPKIAPLFIKINRYSSILNLLNDLKATTMMVKNAIVVQKEIERLAEENRKMIEDGVNKIDDRLIRLDSEFIRPKGFKDKVRMGESSGLDGVVDDLKTQVEDLKSELENIS